MANTFYVVMNKTTLTATALLVAGLTKMYAGPSTFTLDSKLFVFDPGKTGIVSAKWVDKEGLADSGNDLANGKPGKALVLKKLGATSTNASAGASIFGVEWINIRELGFDIRGDGHCGAGAPRFNVVTADGVLHFCGCSGAAGHTAFTDPQGRSWTRVRFSGADCFPPINPTDVVLTIDLVFDEGTDTGPDNTGTATLDNIDVNGTFIEKE
jgi:hypothetical protein